MPSAKHQAKIVEVKPFDYVIFGGTGDLALRKIFPALYYRDLDDQLPKEGTLVAVARSAIDTEAFRARIEAALAEFVPAKFLKKSVIARFLKRIQYRPVDLATKEGYRELAETLDDTGQRKRVFYYALAPSLFGQVSAFLDKAGLITRTSRVVLEKPIGSDLKSSQKVNDEVGKYFRENQIYRIDHYLGKETVQNLMALRFGNVLFENVWNKSVIDHVQITVAETVGLGSRAAYYDTAGAMRDMVQNHLLQLLCLIAMEPPISADPDAVRDEKLKVLKSLTPFDPEQTVHGQYQGGKLGDERVSAYADELGAESRTETFVALRAEIDNWRWAGVPFYLRTGKRMAQRSSEIVVQFKDVPHSVFGSASKGLTPNRLVLNLQPDETVRLELITKVPGPGGMQLRAVPLDLSFKEEFDLQRTPDAYERLLLDVVRGNSTLFMRRDEVEAAWQRVEPVLKSWAAEDGPPLTYYAAGSWGPKEARRLIERDEREWREDQVA